jgi:hypothetical protein
MVSPAGVVKEDSTVRVLDIAPARLYDGEDTFDHEDGI